MKPKINTLMGADEKMDGNVLLSQFLKQIVEDPRIRTSHIALFVAVVARYNQLKCCNPLIIEQDFITQVAKISMTTFHRCVKDLHLYGYFQYCPSYDHQVPSRIFFIKSV